MHPADAGIGEVVHYPWSTGPSGQGSQDCAWCGRSIHAPAVPCSVKPVAGLARIETMPGQGRRCQYELSTRVPEVLIEHGLPTTLP